MSGPFAPLLFSLLLGSGDQVAPQNSTPVAIAPAPLAEEADAPSAPSILADVASLDHDQSAKLCREVCSDPDQSLADRQGALALLASVGSADDLALALELCIDKDSSKVPAQLRRPLFEAVRSILEHDPSAREAIPTLVLTLDSSAGSALVRAVGASGEVDAWQTLDAVLGAGDLLDRITLTSIAELARRYPGTSPQSLVTRVAFYLQDSDSMLARNALMALGALDAQGLQSELVELLDNEDPALVAAAHETLMDVTGLNLPANATRWRMWIEAEESWWIREAEDLFRDIDSAKLSEQCSALQTLSRHRLNRDQIAEHILPLLELESVELRREACRALGNLGAHKAVPALQELQQSYGEGHPAQSAAQAALNQLLGASAAPGE